MSACQDETREPRREGTNRDRVGAMDALAELRRQDGLQKRTTQADADDLPGGPEQIRDCGGRVSHIARARGRRGGNVLPVATARSSRVTLAIIACQTGMLVRWPSTSDINERRTISVVVITLAMPNPWGTMSSHRWNAAEDSSHIATSEAATTVMRHEHRVSV